MDSGIKRRMDRWMTPKLIGKKKGSENILFSKETAAVFAFFSFLAKSLSEMLI